MGSADGLTSCQWDYAESFRRVQELCEMAYAGSKRLQRQWDVSPKPCDREEETCRACASSIFQSRKVHSLQMMGIQGLLDFLVQTGISAARITETESTLMNIPCSRSAGRLLSPPVPSTTPCHRRDTPRKGKGWSLHDLCYCQHPITRAQALLAKGEQLT